MTVSVLMSVYKGDDATLLDRSLDSIWAKQTLKPGEIVLVEDGDLNQDLYTTIRKWRSELGGAIKSVRLRRNVGLAQALNAGLPHCSFDYVARMDPDDVSLPARFERQLTFMRSNPNIDVSSAFIEEVLSDGRGRSIRRLPLAHDELLQYSKTRSPICHAVAIFRKAAILAVGGYPNFRQGQDYALCALLIMNGCRFGNLNDVLYRVEVNDAFFRRRGIRRLSCELAILRYQYRIGFISLYGFIKNTCIRVLGRLAPMKLKEIIYTHFWVSDRRR